MDDNIREDILRLAFTNLAEAVNRMLHAQHRVRLARKHTGRVAFAVAKAEADKLEAEVAETLREFGLDPPTPIDK